MTLPTIDLNTASDEAINAAVAECCDSWCVAFPAAGLPHKETKKGGILLPYRYVNERTHARRMDLPDYLHSADAVIELLEKTDYDALDCFREEVHGKLKWQVSLYDWDESDNKKPSMHGDPSDTFARAACICLLRASGKCQVKE